MKKDGIGQESVFSEEDRQREKFGSRGELCKESPVKKTQRREKKTPRPRGGFGSRGFGSMKKAKQKSREEE